MDGSFTSVHCFQITAVPVLLVIALLVIQTDEAARLAVEAASYRQERKLGLWAAVLCQVDSYGVGSENHGQESLSNFECFRQSQSIRREVRTINL